MHKTKDSDNEFPLTSPVARELGVSSQYVIQLANEGKLAAIKTANGVRLFKRMDVERFKAERVEKKRA
jgi:excisionase family DNA binding protein